MERETKARYIGVAMVALGLVQAASFGLVGDWLFAALGAVYAVIGVFQYRTAEGD